VRKTISTFLAWLLFSATIVAVWFAHMDLWLWHTDPSLGREWNLRVLIPLLALLATGLALVLVNIVPIVQALASRRGLAALNVGVLVAISGGIFGIVNWISARQYSTQDWTLKKIFTISDRTEQVLANLPRKVTAHVIGYPGHESMLTVRGMLDMYKAASRGKLDVDYFDPANDRERAKAKLTSLGVSPDDLQDDDVIVFEAEPSDPKKQPRTKHVAFRDIVEVDYASGRPKGFKAEDVFTETLLEITREKKTAVYLLTGHQELESYGRAPEKRISVLEKTLKKLDYRVESFAFDFASEPKKDEVPADCDVLFIAGPEGRFEDREIAKLKAFLDRGGSLLLLGEPVLRKRPGSRSRYFEETRLDGLLKDYGLTLEPAYVFDPTALVTEVSAFLFAPLVTGVSENHPVTKPLVNRRLIMNVAQPVTVGKAEDPRVKSQAILTTTAQGRGVRDVDGFERDIERTGGQIPPLAETDIKGPVTLAAVATRPVEVTGTADPTTDPKKEARLLVVGDASLAVDPAVQSEPANLDFLINAVSWLGAREESISTGSKQPELIHLRLDKDDRVRIALMSLLELPLLCAAIGLAVYLVRRS
jgi:ABC-type uncharacterized transport system involved in gliding motility auxiliary subunit